MKFAILNLNGTKLFTLHHKFFLCDETHKTHVSFFVFFCALSPFTSQAFPGYPLHVGWKLGYILTKLFEIIRQ